MARDACSACGSRPFRQADGAEWVSVEAGVIDGATGLRIEKRIDEANKGDFHRVPHGFE